MSIQTMSGMNDFFHRLGSLQPLQYIDQQEIEYVWHQSVALVVVE